MANSSSSVVSHSMTPIKTHSDLSTDFSCCDCLEQVILSKWKTVHCLDWLNDLRCATNQKRDIVSFFFKVWHTKKKMTKIDSVRRMYTVCKSSEWRDFCQRIEFKNSQTTRKKKENRDFGGRLQRWMLFLLPPLIIENLYCNLWGWALQRHHIKCTRTSVILHVTHYLIH